MDARTNCTKQLQLQNVSLCIPHKSKEERGAEDASFVSRNAVGVFDGVGGWFSRGVDSGIYSRLLAKLTLEHLQNGGISPCDALMAAAMENKKKGSSTACVYQISGKKLHGVNVGDSGIRIFRDGGLVYASEPLTYTFNTPLQIEYGSEAEILKGRSLDFEVREGDVIIAGSDGLFDNIFMVEMEATVRRHIKSWCENYEGNPTSLHSFDAIVVRRERTEGYKTKKSRRLAANVNALASSLVASAYRTSVCTTGSSPHAEEALENDTQWAGGKPDDITIIVSLVVPDDERYSLQYIAHWP